MNVLAFVLLPMMVFLAMVGYSNAAYCVCNSGASETAMQQNIDYACGAGADCHQINQNGPCYNPNTLRDHCNFAVNNYFQKKGQTPISCQFSGTATVTPSAPSVATSACFSGSASSSTPTNPTIAPPGSGTGTGTSTGTGISPTFGSGGLAPSGATGLNNDNSGAITIHQTTTRLIPTLLVSSLVWSRRI